MRSQALIGLAALAAVVVSLAAAPLAQGAIDSDEELFSIGGAGSAAGQFSIPRGVASDPVTGHFYVVESNNFRVSEFTPWGEFVKAFGWDVVPGAVNEQQEVRVRATEGEFKLSLGAETTGDLPFDAKAPEVEAALKGLAAIGSEGVSVKSVPGTVDGITPYIHVVAFKGPLAATDVAQLTTTNGTNGTAEVRTRADGHGATAGLESCTAESGCKAGLSGSGAGQLDGARGVAVDAAGDVYVREVDNRRVQKFDPAGRFILMFGGEVNKTSGAVNPDICTKASGDECGAGVVGSGPGEFGEGFASGITLNAAGALFAGDVDRIQRFNSAGEWQASVACPGKTIHTLAIAPGSSDFYAVVGSPSGPEADVRKLDGSSCAEIGRLKGTGGAQGAVATDAGGNVFMSDGSQVLEFGPSGSPLSPASCCAGEVGVLGLGTNAIGDLYVASADTPTGTNIVRAFGPPPVSFEGPPPVAPQVVTQFAISVGRESATVGADINPNFFTDTTYYVQYGTGKCSEGGCAQAPVAPVPLTKKAIKAPVRAAGVLLAGLAPGSVYHYRFVAQSSGGGPVFGAEAQFTTFPAATAPPACANDIYRFGAAAQLPDCRAYEMVSPVDKNNGDIKTLLNITSFTTNLSQSSVDGNRFTYSSQRGFADPKAATYTNQYLADRDPVSGWSSESLEPAQTSEFSGNSFENHYKLFSADLCKSWLVVAAEPVLAPGAISGQIELYSRNTGGSCGAVGHEALIQADKTSFPLLQGAAADGSKAIFAAQAKLTPEAAGGGLRQVYYTGSGGLRLVCVLPSGLANASNCTAGTGGDGPGSSTLPLMERLASLTNALSADGSKAYWTDLPPATGISGPGKVYLRLNPGAEQSGSGCEEGMACTVAVSGTVNQQDARFLRASADGNKALFEITTGALARNLYMFDAEALSSTLIAGKSLGVAGASDDLSRVYFVSEDVLAGTSGAGAGEPNLYYLDGEGVKTFVAGLAAGDVVDGSRASNTNPRPIYHAARATPDGRVLVFTSSEPLTGYDNTDQLNGKADSEVYRYEAGAGGPVCVSCNPSGARPRGRILLPAHFSAPIPAAAWLPFPENSLYTPRVISEDGRRLFFNSFDALLPRDSNGKADVYQWESAPGQAACDEMGAELYVPDSGGCLSLISTGQSPQDSELLDISAAGDDAFFTTSASLLPRDPGLVDAYDARVGGGIAEAPAPAPVCQGETCQPVVPAPPEQTPSSSSYVGPEDEKPAKKKKAKKKKKKSAKHKSAKKKQHKNKSNKHRADRGQGGRG